MPVQLTQGVIVISYFLKISIHYLGKYIPNFNNVVSINLPYLILSQSFYITCILATSNYLILYEYIQFLASHSFLNFF